MRLSALVALAACSSPPKTECETKQTYAIVASDYTSTLVGGATLERARLRGGVDLGMDPVLVTSRGRAFLLARDTGAVFELDACGAPRAALPFPPKLANPWDLALAPDGRAFVALYDRPEVLGETAIDLSAYDDDKNPQASALAFADGKLFVALQRLDPDFVSRRPSSMAVIEGGQVTRTSPLPGRNPFPPLLEDGGSLWMAAPGNFAIADETDAGLVRFDPRSMTGELVMDERALGGSLGEARVDGRCALGVIAEPSALNKTTVVAIDLDARTVTPLLRAEGFFHRGLHLEKDRALVGDRQRGPRGFSVRVIPRSGCAFDVARATAIDLALPPVGVGAL